MMRSRTLKVLIPWAVVVMMASPAAPAPMAAPVLIQNVGLQTPESVLYDATGDVYLVANINGNPADRDGNGFISRISPNGRTVTLKWIDGTKSGVTLNAPKGMAIARGTLYVADITAVRMFDRRTGRFKGSIDIPGATFVNDLAAGPDGSVYVTDSGMKPDFSPSGTDAVYRIMLDGKIDTVAKRTQLKHPNGVTVRPDGKLAIVNFDKPGLVVILGLNGQVLSTWTMPAGQLDGVEALPDGSLLVSSWESSTVYRVTSNGTATAVVENAPSPADFGYDRKRNRILIPLFTKNQVAIHSLK